MMRLHRVAYAHHIGHIEDEMVLLPAEILSLAEQRMRLYSIS